MNAGHLAALVCACFALSPCLCNREATPARVPVAKVAHQTAEKVELIVDRAERATDTLEDTAVNLLELTVPCLDCPNGNCPKPEPTPAECTPESCPKCAQAKTPARQVSVVEKRSTCHAKAPSRCESRCRRPIIRRFGLFGRCR